MNCYYDQVLALRHKSRIQFLACMSAVSLGLLLLGHFLSGTTIVITISFSFMAFYASKSKWRINIQESRGKLETK